MKTARKALKLLPPAFAMRIWLKRRYAIEVPAQPWGKAAGALLAILPYAFTAALSQRKDTDVRLLKYYLPYGKISKFVKMAYGMERGNTAKDKGPWRLLRAAMPYGLVLWWDAEDARLARGKANNKRKAAVTTPAHSENTISDAELAFLASTDKTRALALRCLLNMPSDIRQKHASLPDSAMSTVPQSGPGAQQTDVS